MRKPLWISVFIFLTIALCDLVIFSWWLPGKLETYLTHTMKGGNLQFEDINLNWRTGRLVGGTWENSKISLHLGEGSFSYSPWDWIFAGNTKINHLKLMEFDISGKKIGDGSTSVRKCIDYLRENPMNYAIESVDMSGKFRQADYSVPFSLFAFKDTYDRFIKSAIEIRLDKILANNSGLFPSKKNFLLKVDFYQKSKSNENELTVLVKEGNWLDLNFTTNGSEESVGLIISSENNGNSKLSISTHRPLLESNFTGEWRVNMDSKDFIKEAPFLSLMKGNIMGLGKIEFDSQVQKLDLNGGVDFQASSPFFPEEGSLRGSLDFDTSVTGSSWENRKFSLLIENNRGEKLEISSTQVFSNLESIRGIVIHLSDLKIGRFKNHFEKGSLLSGRFFGAINDEILSLSGENLILNKSDGSEDTFNLSFEIPLFSKIQKEKGVKFNLKFPLNDYSYNHFFPSGIFPENFIFKGGIEVSGFLRSGHWLIEDGNLELTNIQNNKAINIRVVNPFEINFNHGELNWVQADNSEKENLAIQIKGLDYKKRYPLYGLTFQNTQKDINGSVILNGGKPVFLFDDFILAGNLGLMEPKRSLKIISKGDLSYYPKKDGDRLIYLNKSVLASHGMDLLSGELKFTDDGNKTLKLISSDDLKVNSEFLKLFDFWTNDRFQVPSVDIHKLEWKLLDRHEVSVDGLVKLSGLGGQNNNERSKEFDFPIKWTFVRKSESDFHWGKVFLKKFHSSDVEINYESEKKQLLISANRINIDELKPLFLSGISDFESITDSLDILTWHSLPEKIKIKIDSLLILNSKEISNFTALFSKNNKTLSFEFEFGKAPVSGELRLLISENNVSKPVNYEITLFGKNLDATLFKTFLNNAPKIDGNFDFQTKMTGGMFSFKGKTQIDFRDLSFSLLPMRQQGKFLQDQMETSLGSSFAWSASQTKVMDVFQQFLKDINFEKGSVSIIRAEGGKWEFELNDWIGSEIMLRGKGTVSAQNKLKISFFPGFKGRFANFLDATHILADGKKRMGYRVLKSEPLVIEGTLTKPKFTNWWKMFGQGIGLEPKE